MADVFEADDDFGFAAWYVVADVVRDEFLLEATEVEVAAISEQFGSMLLITNVNGITLQYVQ